MSAPRARMTVGPGRELGKFPAAPPVPVHAITSDLGVDDPDTRRQDRRDEAGTERRHCGRGHPFRSARTTNVNTVRFRESTPARNGCDSGNADSHTPVDPDLVDDRLRFVTLHNAI